MNKGLLKMQTPSRGARSDRQPKRKRFSWLMGMLVSSVLLVILIFVVVVLLVLSSQGITQGITTLTILSIVAGFVVSVLSLLVSFLQWHHPKAIPASEERLSASFDHSSPLSTGEHPQSDVFLIDPRREHLEKQADLPEATQMSRCVDWGEAPHLDQFYGRDQELATLKRWMMEDSCRIVAILGMGGIGKTSLAATLVEQVQEHYDYVCWRSLHNAPPVTGILQECIHFVLHQQHVVLPEEIDRQISVLIESFRTCRCLLVLDNVEAILQGGSQVGQYREDYEGYGRLFQRIGESQHHSCLLLTSREKPKEVALLEGEQASTRSYHLVGLPPEASQEILNDKGLEGSEHTWEALITAYAGNPLALKLAAQVIREVFGGQIRAFLKGGEVFFQDVRDVLEQQMARLSVLEEEIIYWLAIEREAIGIDRLQEDLVHAVSKGELQEALRSLRRRQLIETSATGSTLHPVIIEYLTARFVDRVSEEIRTETLMLFAHHAVLLAQAKDSIRESQRRLILLPLVQRLLDMFGKEMLEQRFQRLLATLHAQDDSPSSYAAGNVLNLLVQMGCALRGYDFSHLVVRQAFLQGVVLPAVNFASADLATSVFTDTFGRIVCVAFRPQGDLLVAGTERGELRFWHAVSGTPLQTFGGHTDWVRSVAFSPDGRTVVSGSDDQTVRVWEMSSGICLTTLQGHTNRVWSVAFSPDGKILASGSPDRLVRLWEMSSGTCLKILQGHVEGVRSVAFSPDGRTVASGSEDQTVRLWEVSSGKSLTPLQGHAARVLSVAFSPDGSTLASGSEDQTVRLWEVSSGKSLTTLQGHASVVRSVAFRPDGSIVASGSPDQVRLWEISGGKPLTTLQGYTNRVGSITFSPDGSVLVGGYEDRTVRLWEISSGKVLKILQGHVKKVRSVAFSPDGQMLASSGLDQTIRLWEVNSGQCKAVLGPSQGIWSMAFSPDGKILASGGEDQTVRLWEVSSGKPLKTLQGHTRVVLSVAFSPDGSTLASGSEDQTVRLWEVRSGQCRAVLEHNNWVNVVAFSPDGKILASGSEDRALHVWEVSSGACLKTLPGHSNRVGSLAFSPDGRTLASGSEDRAVRLWEVNSGQYKTIRGPSHWVGSMAFSPDGKLFASGSDEGAIALWDMQTGACLRTLRSERPYERMNITQVKGLTEGQKATLRSLGAIENEGA
jgi:WD40 repeat protein